MLTVQTLYFDYLLFTTWILKGFKVPFYSFRYILADVMVGLPKMQVVVEGRGQKPRLAKISQADIVA